VQLFIATTSALHFGFLAHGENLQQLLQSVGASMASPLAIDLPATRVATLGLPAGRPGLDDRLGMLDQRSPTALPRHQTLRATL